MFGPAADREDSLGAGIARFAESIGHVPTSSELREYLRDHGISAVTIDDLVSARQAAQGDRQTPRFDEQRPPSRLTDRQGNLSIARHLNGDKHSEPETASVDWNWWENDEEDLPELDISSSEVAGVDRATDDLIDDWRRTDRPVTAADVTSLVAKRGLSAEAHARVVSNLISIGAYRESVEDERQRSGRPTRPGGLGDLLGVFLREISRYPLIDAEEEVRLGRAIRAGQQAHAAIEQGVGRGDYELLDGIREQGKAAHRRLVEANLRLVVSVAKRTGRGLASWSSWTESSSGTSVSYERRTSSTRSWATSSPPTRRGGSGSRSAAEPQIPAPRSVSRSMHTRLLPACSGSDASWRPVALMRRSRRWRGRQAWS